LRDGFIEEFLGYLNLIHHLSVGENAKRTQNMIQNVVSLTKYKFLRKDEIVKLKEELAYIDILIEIFRVRFGDQLEFLKDIEEETKHIYIPSFTVIAFIENALIHGLIPKEGDWKLKLRIDSDENNILIQIEDNGIGFDTSILDASYHAAEEIDTISSVISRMQAYYPNTGLVSVSSLYGRGTCVKITVPK
jgi:two-component system, sensor histidine kinase YesM